MELTRPAGGAVNNGAVYISSLMFTRLAFKL
jgi:hypothetical protein